MPDPKDDPTLNLFGGAAGPKPPATPAPNAPINPAASTSAPASKTDDGKPVDNGAANKPTEAVAGQAVQQPTEFRQPSPQEAVRGQQQSPPGLTTLTIAAVDQHGNDIPAGAYKGVVEEFTGIGWNHLHEVRITSLGTKVELLRGRRLIIEQIGDV